MFHRPRGGGKTFKLAELARQTGGVIITTHAEMAKHICESYGLERDQAVSYRQVENGCFRGMRPRPIYIDDADTILRMLLRLDRIDGLGINSGMMRADGTCGPETI